MSIESQAHEASHGRRHDVDAPVPGRTTPVVAVVGAWLVVATPLAYGLWQTLAKAAKLFTG